MSVFWKTHLVAPSSHKFSIYLLFTMNCQSRVLCPRGVQHRIIGYYRQENMFAAVNKPTSLKKQNFFVLKKRNYFNFGIPAAAPGSRCRLQAPRLTGGWWWSVFSWFFVKLHFVRILLCILFHICQVYKLSSPGSAPLGRCGNHQPSFPPAATSHRHPQEHPVGWNPAHVTSPAGFESR